MEWAFYYNETHDLPQMHGFLAMNFGGNEADIVDNIKPNMSYIACPKNITNSEYYFDISTAAFVQKTDASFSVNKNTIIADGIDECIVSNLPMPCTLTVNADEVTVDDGTLELTSDTPGKYCITCQTAQHYLWEVTIYAV